MRIMAVLAVGLSTMLGATAGAQDETPVLHVTPEQREAARAYMNQILEVAAEDIWNTDGFEGEDADAAWTALHDRAMALRSLGEGLKTAAFAYERNDIWTTYAQAVVDAAEVTLRAADARDVDAFDEAGDVVYTSCESCHRYYAEVAPPPEVATQPQE
jgi:cytochrome c556